MFEFRSAQTLTKHEGQIDSISVSAKPGVSDSVLQDRVSYALPSSAEAVTGSQLSDESSKNITQGFSFFSTFLLVFAFIALFVGGFIVYNTFGIVVAQRTREMALLRALGASGRQVVNSVIVESLILGLVSSAVGLVGGLGLGFALKQLLSALGFGVPSGAVVVLPRTVFVSLLGGTTLTILSALTPAFRAARVPPLAAAQTVARETVRVGYRRPIAGGVLAVLGTGAVWRGATLSKLTMLGLGSVLVVLGTAFLAPFIARPVAHLLGVPLRLARGVSGHLAEENAARNARRTATTASALMIGTALISGSMVLASSISTSVDHMLNTGVTADLVVRSQGFAGLANGLAPALQRVDGVEAVEPMRYGSFKLGTVDKVAFAVNSSVFASAGRPGMLDLDVIRGTMTGLDNGGLAVSEQVAKSRRWKIGSVVGMGFSGGTTQQKIEAIYRSVTFGDFFVSLNTFNAVVARSVDTNLLLRVTPGRSVEQVKTSVKAAVEVAGPGATVQDKSEWAGAIKAQISQLLNLITALVLLAILIALLGVLLTMMLSVLERTHELGLLRAVGMDRRWVSSMVRWEAGIISTFGAAMGTVLGVGLGYALSYAMRNRGVTATAIPVRNLSVVILVIALAGIGASLYPARRAGRLDVLTAIATA